jgi:hypothetical protein
VWRIFHVLRGKFSSRTPGCPLRAPVEPNGGLGLGYLAAGRTDREIAEALLTSKKTASVHVSNLARELDASNREGAGRVGQALGLGL